MPAPRPSALALSQRYALGLVGARRGPIGEQLGRSTGGSLEFEDRRAWRVGDDVRRIDWRALGRTDQVLVRLYRDEIAPRVELVLDGSSSMATDPDKAQLAVDLAALLALAAQGAGLQAALLVASERPESIPIDRFLAHGIEFDARTSLSREVETLLRPGALRIAISDFFVRAELGARLRSLAARAGGLACVQVLSTFDSDPASGDALRLTDAETREGLDLVVDAAARKRYLQRLARLNRELADECSRLAATQLSLVAVGDLEAQCSARLVPTGVLVPR
ncbi:MAG: DUF58 domain-containing protein [Planctomycetota bacterium]|nr:MAG: DUF58 domain-containing protein [Planctomycetota bacterium]